MAARDGWIAAGLAVLAGCGGSGGSVGGASLSGAGSTFVYPAMTRWIADYGQKNPGVRINYQSIGSGGGIEQVKNKTVDFGASDAALTDEQLKNYPAVVQIPETAGPVCITYNLPGAPANLQLSGPTLAGMFLGTVKTWNDPRVAADNPGAKLPNLPVIVAHRADSSGTTAIFTDYLAAVSPDWKSKVGAGKSVSWPVGLGGKGSEGVTGQLRQSPGAVGYVELTYAEQNHLPEAKIKNAAGAYVGPTVFATTASVSAFSKELGADPRHSIVNPPAANKDAYPIAGLTFLILPRDAPDKTKAAALKKFVEYVIGEGQASAAKLDYAPLPEAIRAYDAEQLRNLRAQGQPLP